MVDFTILELHVDGLDTSELPFGTGKSTAVESKKDSMLSSVDRSSDSSSGGDGIRDRVPSRLLVAIVILVIGAIVAMKLLGRDPVDEMAEEF